ncbi:MAG: flagellar M-ring protein FliF [Ignavibacteriae bacterium]|nr:flagellar M-ring protein FliF [Ignavibacteriota bacterium]MCB9206125.1 flagellar M-ring protein FliF [Ignavibacteriales bacterium]MCB9209398.1 flagellar M-ring protein FliF [Ignavibacteriales bacterium]MCB9258041.1 flagellar M-ring protein FliF [Ignavibacteriales bacterium]
MLGGISIVSIVLLLFILFAFNEPTYTTLYSNLAQEEASEVVSYLNTQKIPYKLENGGNTINVSKTDVYEVRLALAGKGIPASGMIGYEIFDKNTIGMSEFMQKINFKRALEGEIARTIIQQDGVENARVHIVTPEKAVFKDEQQEATASIVLKLRSGAILNQSNITAIINLVASSVESLDPKNVTIIDNKGRLLSKKQEESELAINSGKQYEIKSGIENYLANKAKSILDKVVGYENSDVRVNVELDFKQIEKTLETIDPESQVAISEQSTRNTSSGKSMSDSNAVFSESSTTNYELSKTIEHMIEGSGNIKRITVAAVINGVTKEVQNGENTEMVNEPRSDEQLQQLELLLRQAVGIDDTRNDEISIVSIPFENNNYDAQFVDGTPVDNLEQYVNYFLLLIGVAGASIVLKGLLKRLKEEKITIGTVGAGGYSDQTFDAFQDAPTWEPNLGIHKTKRTKKPLFEMGDIEDEITDEAVMKKMKQDKIINYVSKNPAEAAKLINSWLKEDEYN